jgi:hypothetical protein
MRKSRAARPRPKRRICAAKSAAGSGELIDSERDKAGRPLVILAALTRMLPADTYLTEFGNNSTR